MKYRFVVSSTHIKYIRLTAILFDNSALWVIDA